MRINDNVKDAIRTKLFYRLNNLQGEGLVNGKFVGLAMELRYGG